MTSTVEPGPAPVRPSLYDRWWVLVRADPRTARLVDAFAPILLTLLAAVLRFANLANPHALVFDETYYVKDAWSQWNLGYPAVWPLSDTDALFAEGDTDTYSTNGSFVVHPPLGKWIIGAGMALFGADSSFGWRFSVALFGTATVLLVYLVAKTLTRSTPVAALAGLLMAVDGLAIVLSRIALLDGIIAFFALLAFWFVLLDRRRHQDRLALARRPGRRAAVTAWGPILWGRPWLVAAGLAAGAATAVKWSGLYVLAALGIYVVVTDALARRRLGVRLWPLGAVGQGAVAAVLMLPVAAVVYLASWTGWLLTADGYARQDDPSGGMLSWLPRSLQALIGYHEAVYEFHVGLSTPHSYESPAWQWPLLVRPTSMYWNDADGTVQAVSSIPNPLIWWAGAAAVVYLVYRFVVRRDMASAFVLTGVVATYVPWLLYPERTIFQFYTIVILPFLVIAIALAARDIAGAADASAERRKTGQRVVWVFLVGVIALSIFWYPVWTGLPVPYEFWRLHNWLQTWV